MLVARSQAALEQLAEELKAAHHIQASAIAMDLSVPGAAAKLVAAVVAEHLTVDLLINNAGFGTYGDFVQQDAAKEATEIELNIGTLTGLTHAFLPGMLERGSGWIVNVASLAAFQPVPYMAVYAATKAYVLSFTTALWGEYQNRGVKFLALCPGPTQTSFFTRAGSDEFARKGRRTTEQVLATMYRALERNQPAAVDGWRNDLIAQSGRFFSRKSVARLGARITRPKQ